MESNMSAKTYTVDTSELTAGIAKLKKTMDVAYMAGLNAVASEILRVEQNKVPHDKGDLQASAQIDQEKDDVIVGYNKVYAARLHENPQFHFQKGRKGKYLEDPIKNHLHTYLDFLGGEISTFL